MQTYAFIKNNLVEKVEACSEESYLEQASHYQNIVDVTDMLPMPQVGWSLVGNILTPSIPLSQEQRDFIRFMKRANVKNQIVAEMAMENMARLRAGVWTTANLTALTQDAELKLVLDDVNTLSYELAIPKVQALTNPIITPQIKAGWVAKLMSHFYN